jgi:hypothetical protein
MKGYQTLYQSNVNDMVLLCNCLSKCILRGQPIPLAARWACGGFLAVIAGSNPAGGTGYVSLASVACFQAEISALD